MILELMFLNNIWGFSSFNPVHWVGFNTNARETNKSLTGCESSRVFFLLVPPYTYLWKKILLKLILLLLDHL